MEGFAMRMFPGVFAGCCLMIGGLFSGGSTVASAQEKMGPPPVLVIEREYLKPGRAGSVHEKSESAFVRAMTAAKWPTHYLAVESMSGRSRALFFMGFGSFAAWEKDNQNEAKNATLAAALDHAELADGDLLTEYDQGVFSFREEMSLRSNFDIAPMRYF